MGIFASFLKSYLLTNFDIVVHSAYLVDTLCGTPKYFDGASLLVWELNNSHWHYKFLSFRISLLYRTFQRASKLITRERHICEFLTNFDIVVHSAYLVDALCGTPKYFDGASSLVWDLRAQYQNWRSPGTLCVYVYRVFCQKQCSVSFPQIWLQFLWIYFYVYKRNKPCFY